MQVGWNAPSQTHFVTVQFNPGKLKPLGWAELCGDLCSFLPSGYVSLFYRAAIAEVEIAFDVYGADREDYLFFDTKARGCDIEFDAKGTLYVGSRNSRGYWCLYDKRKETKTKGGPWMRLERVVKRPEVLLCHADELPPQFDTLWVLDRKTLQSAELSRDARYFRFLVTAMNCEAQEAYSYVDHTAALLKDLKLAVPPWYEPVEIWKRFPRAIDILSPAAVETATGTPHDVSSQFSGPSVPPVH
jgi:hypothetical protein